MGFLSNRAFAIGLTLMVVLSSTVIADEPSVSKLPDPLTLKHALSLADEAHPDLLLKDAEILSAEARRKNIEATGGINVDLDFSVFATDDDSDRNAWRRDHARAGVIVSSTFYDFGHTDSLLTGADELRYSRELAYHDTRGQRRLDIMAAYFDVLLADLKFSLYNEAMAVGYVNYDKAKDRRELGQRTDLEVARREAEYQKLRVLRYQSENQQRETRAKLAEILNRPGQLPANLAIPKLDAVNRNLVDIDELQKQALEKNFHINALRHEVIAAESDLAAARQSDGPKLRGRVEAYGFESEQGNTDEVRAELSLIYNLHKPERDGDVATELSRLYAARAQLQKAESDLRQETLKTWHHVEELKAQRDETEVLLVLRELQLEKSRALYEMEVKADLGYSMSALTEAQLKSAKTDYQLALAWFKLDLLTANVVLDLKHRTKQPEENLRAE